MPKLELKKCTKRGEPVELKLLGPAKLIEIGCMELTAYDNYSREPRKDEITR